MTSGQRKALELAEPAGLVFVGYGNWVPKPEGWEEFTPRERKHYGDRARYYGLKGERLFVVSRVVNRLTEDGLLLGASILTVHDGNRWNWLITITEKGREALRV